MPEPVVMSPDDREFCWFAVHVKSRHEFQVVDRLTKAGIEAFLPAVERSRKWKDRKKLVVFPLFPGYLFVHIERNHPDRLTVLKTRGVVRFLGLEPGSPEPVPDEQITSLQRVIENRQELDPYPYLKEGQRVRIKYGPLSGIEGVLVERLEGHMLVLSVDILQQGAALKIDISEVEET